MAFNKILQSEINANNVKSVTGNRLTGTPQQNKATFDKLVELVCSKLNDVIDILDSVNGANSIGITPINGVTGINIQTALGSIKSILDGTYTKTATDELLINKADTTIVNSLVKSVAFNESDGKFTITKQDGTTNVIDTLLEKVITNFSYDSTTQSLVLTTKDGVSQSISLAEFITNNEFTDSEQISFSVTNGIVKANIKSGSITDSMLNSSIMTTLLGYKTIAETSATNAKSSETNALSYKNISSEKADIATAKALLATNSANDAENAEATAIAKATEASTSASNAALSESNAATSETNASASKNSAAISETNAAKSATEAATSASEAAASAVSAANSAANAADIVANKENKPTYVTSSLTLANWINGVYSFETTYPVATYDLEIQPSSTCTQVEIEAWGAALITSVMDSNTIKALGDIPTINIPVILKVVAK